VAWHFEKFSQSCVITCTSHCLFFGGPSRRKIWETNSIYTNQFEKDFFQIRTNLKKAFLLERAGKVGNLGKIDMEG